MPQPAPAGGSGARRARPARRAIGLALWSFFTLAVFAIAFTALAPAEALRRGFPLPAEIEAMSGRSWQGGARIAGGHALEWHLRWTGVDLALVGPDTRLTGRLTPEWRALGVGLSLDGRAGAGLLALAPGLDGLSCTMGARLDGVRVSWGRSGMGASGLASTPEGRCERAGREAVLPPMRAILSSQRGAAVARLSDDAGEALASVRLDQGRIGLRVESAGAALIPGLPSGGPIEIEREIGS